MSFEKELELQLIELRKWLEVQKEMNPRTDDEFLLTFLHGSDLDLDVAKKTISKYYENKLMFPQWFKNRDLNNPDVNFTLHTNRVVALKETDLTNPTVVFQIISRFGNKVEDLDIYTKLSTVFMEKIARRESCQINGMVCICDCRNLPWWPVTHMSVQRIKNSISTFCEGTPIKVKKLIIIEPPFIARVILKVAHPFLSGTFADKIKIVSGDWSSLYKIIPREILPEEYGGLAGALKDHEDAFIEELMMFNQYLLEDEKFGYQNLKC